MQNQRVRSQTEKAFPEEETAEGQDFLSPLWLLLAISRSLLSVHADTLTSSPIRPILTSSPFLSFLPALGPAIPPLRRQQGLSLPLVPARMAGSRRSGPAEPQAAPPGLALRPAPRFPARPPRLPLAPSQAQVCGFSLPGGAGKSAP